MRFKVNEATGKLSVEVHDVHGNLLFTVPSSTVLDVASGGSLPSSKPKTAPERFKGNVNAIRRLEHDLGHQLQSVQDGRPAVVARVRHAAPGDGSGLRPGHERDRVRVDGLPAAAGDEPHQPAVGPDCAEHAADGHPDRAARRSPTTPRRSGTPRCSRTPRRSPRPTPRWSAPPRPRTTARSSAATRSRSPQLASASQRTFQFTSPTSADTVTIDGQQISLAAGASAQDLVNAINSNQNATRLGDRHGLADNGPATVVLSDRATGQPDTPTDFINVSDHRRRAHRGDAVRAGRRRRAVHDQRRRDPVLVLEHDQRRARDRHPQLDHELGRDPDDPRACR